MPTCFIKRRATLASMMDCNLIACNGVLFNLTSTSSSLCKEGASSSGQPGGDSAAPCQAACRCEAALLQHSCSSCVALSLMPCPVRFVALVAGPLAGWFLFYTSPRRKTLAHPKALLLSTCSFGPPAEACCSLFSAYLPPEKATKAIWVLERRSCVTYCLELTALNLHCCYIH